MKAYGFKIMNLMDFIDPEKVVAVGENYIVATNRWNVIRKTPDRHKIFWQKEEVSKIIIGLLTDEIYDGVEVIEGELNEFSDILIIYHKNMAPFSDELQSYLASTPNKDVFFVKCLEVLNKICIYPLNNNNKELNHMVKFGTFDIEEEQVNRYGY